MEKESVLPYSMMLSCGIGLVLILSIILISSPEEFFTELYFENSDSLPNMIFLNENYSFSFTIENKEESDQEYNYKVYMYLDGEKSLLEENTFILDRGSKATKLVSFKVEESFKQGLILIEVNSEQIYFQFEEQ